MKISEIISRISNFHPPVDERKTCDVIKVGDPNQECTGIVTTVYASIDVIKKAVNLGANMIICHEPLFYSNDDRQDWLKGNSVYEQKVALLNEHHMVVWRDHDRIHGGSPSRIRDHMDMVFYGIMQELGWTDYCVGFDKKPLLYEIPETTTRKLAENLIKKFGLKGARIVGNENARIKRVFFCEHINGSNWGGRQADCEKIREIEVGDFDAIIPFEIVDWTLSEYIRDAAQLGQNKVIIEMGHFNVEEIAMKYMQKWLTELLDEETAVYFVQSGDSFTYLLAANN